MFQAMARDRLAEQPSKKYLFKEQKDMQKEIIDFLLVVKEIAVDVVTAFTEQSENAKKIADTFQRGIKAIDVLLGEDAPKVIEEKTEVIEEPKKDDKPISLEDVRKVLANLSRNGKTKEVKALLQKYGADKLSAINKDDYPALLKDAEEL